MKPGEGVERKWTSDEIETLVAGLRECDAMGASLAASCIEALRERAERAERQRDAAEASEERLEAVLLSKHGGEPLALLEELDEARAKLAELERERDEAQASYESECRVSKTFRLALEVARIRSDRTEAAESQVAELRKALEEIASHDFGTCAYIGLEHMVHTARTALSSSERRVDGSFPKEEAERL
jgi:predicted RNase H-like nuclease (RuvC/YqgF family)